MDCSLVWNFSESRKEGTVEEALESRDIMGYCG